MFGAAATAWSSIVERGFDGLLDRWVMRRLAVPPGTRVVAIGGSTLGGSGKTPLAIACAAELAQAGARCVLVGHAYRADPRRARFVLSSDRLDEVGDEALLAARALEPLGARVVVAPSRAEAIAYSARVADVLVLDGIAQLSPARATLALLSVDAAEPWGRSRALPPFGVLRAPVAKLVAACDAIVPMGLEGDAGLESFDRLGRHMWPSRVESRGAWDDRGVLLTWEAMRSLRVGLLVALGRPERLLRGLARRGIFPRAIVRGRDHGPLVRPRFAVRRAVARGIDVWLATHKCALHTAPRLPGLAVLEQSVTLNSLLRSRLRAIVGGAALTGGVGTNSLELLESTSQSRSMAADWVPSAQPLEASGVKMMTMRRRA